MAGDHLDIASAVALEAQIVVMLKYLQRVGSRATAARELGQPRPERARRARREGRALDDARAPARRGRRRRRGRDRRHALHRLPVVGRSGDAEGGRRPARARCRAAEAGVGWVYHAPPSDSPTSWNGTRHFGDDALVTWIRRYRPAMVFAGHIHQSPFREGGSWVDRIERHVDLQRRPADRARADARDRRHRRAAARCGSRSPATRSCRSALPLTRPLAEIGPTRTSPAQ